MEVILKQRVFSSSLRLLGEEGETVTVDDETGKAMIEADQAEAPKKRAKRPAKNTSSKSAASREKR